VPTYDYECDACGRTYEVRQRISAAPLTTCQFCNGHVRRLLSPAPFILKGGGWYVTDYPSESRKKAMDAEKKTSEPAAAAKSSDGGSKSSDGGSKSSDGGSKSSESGSTGSTASSTSSSSSGSGSEKS
jgi:putative FmdB family regulatory protein